MKCLLLALLTVAVTAQQDRCSLPADKGPCRALIPRVYFNPRTGNCETFTYGGCGGNDNNFLSVEGCESACKKESSYSGLKESVCVLEADSGPCRGFFQRFFFNSKTGQCESFIFGGCGGNSNNFGSEEECSSSCSTGYANKESLCALEVEAGPCRGFFPRFFFNSKTGKCESFVFGGCGGNSNNFATEEECNSACHIETEYEEKEEEQDVCSLKAETGLCEAYFPRFFFNKDSGRCEVFIYGGCGGNLNNFKNEEECRNTCQKEGQQSTPKPFKYGNCLKEADSGVCRGAFPRFFFNRSKGQCEEFVYGGCGGNENNFLTMEDCENHCLI